MGKETKIGLAIIGLLLVVFGIVLYSRISRVQQTVVSPKQHDSKKRSPTPTVVSAEEETGWSKAPGRADQSPKQSFMPRDTTASDPTAAATAATDPAATDTAATDTAAEPGNTVVGSEPTATAAADDNRYATTEPRYPSEADEPSAAAPSDPFQRVRQQSPDVPKTAAKPAEDIAASAAKEAIRQPLAEPTSEPAALSAAGQATAPKGNPLRSAIPIETAAEEASAGVATQGNVSEASRYADSDGDSPTETKAELVSETEPADVSDRPAAHVRPAARALPVARAPQVRSQGGDRYSAQGSVDAGTSDSGSSETASEPRQIEDVQSSRAVRNERRAPHASNPIAAAAAGEAARSGRYTVRPNENFSTIAEQMYGSSGYFKALAEHNRRYFPDPSDLQVGDIVATPPVEVLERNYPELVPKRRNIPSRQSLAVRTSAQQPTGRVYVVEEGDTLFDIARYQLGKASRWDEIHALNQHVLGDDFDYLQPGTELQLPSNGRDEDALTARPTTRR